MAWINKYLSTEDLEKIEQAITQAEAKTSGEIVPVIVRRSANVAHVPAMLTLFLMVCLLFVRPAFLEMLWVGSWYYLWPVIAAVIFLLSVLASRLKFVQKIFVSESAELDAVHQRAELEFYRNKVFRTHAGAGILIFVSVMERKAVILADKRISDKIPPEHWNEVLNKFRDHLHKKEWLEAFVEAIEICGEDLAAHFPADGNLDNELTNHLVVRD